MSGGGLACGVYYIQSEKVRGLQPHKAPYSSAIQLYPIGKSQRPATSLPPARRWHPLYPIGKSQRPATTLRVNELDAHQSSFSAFLPS